MNAAAQISANEFAHHPPVTTSVSRRQLWIGRILSGITSAFFLLDGGMKLAKPAPIVQATMRLGYPESAIVGTGVVLLLCTALYLVPRTASLAQSCSQVIWVELWLPTSV